MTFSRTFCGLIRPYSINKSGKTNSDFKRIYTDEIVKKSLDNFDDLEDKLSIIVGNRTEIQAIKIHFSMTPFITRPCHLLPSG